MSFRRYEKYKDSGVDWLGKVPAHWSAVPLKRVSPSQTVGIVVNPSEYVAANGLPYLYGGDIQAGWVDHVGSRRISQEDSDRNPKTKLRAGDLVTVRVGAPGVTAVVPAECEGGNCASVMLIRRGSYDSRWLCYVMNDRVVRYQVEVVQYGAAQEQFNISHAVNFIVPRPTREEQSAIANFLDRGTAKIDALVDEQQRLIELLNEKRQAVISHAVTKGLNPKASMKDSGVEWLGVIPEHWEVRRVKDVARLESGHTPSKQVPEYWENCDIPWVSLNDSKQLAVVEYISETAFQINDLGLANSSARLLPPGAVVFTRDATIGLAAITTRSMAVSQHLIAWCPGEQIQALFLLRVFNVMKDFLDTVTFGATIKTIGMADVKKLVTPVPPLAEQHAITEFTSKQKAKFDALIVEAELAVELLQERRTALISAAVTGKIDVRHHQREAA